MSEAISVFIPCNIPTVTAQQKGTMVRNGKVRFFKKKKVQQSENTFHALLYPYRPKKPLDGPVCLIVSLVFPWRKTESKKKREGYTFYPVTVRPDLSNLIKTIEDVMTTLQFWNDDGQISTLKVSKQYGERPGIGLNITRDLAMDKDGKVASA